MELWITFRQAARQRNMRRRLEQAALAAYAIFARRHPAWAAALFDEHFVRHHLLPRLVEAARSGQPFTAAAAAELWAVQVGCTAATRRRQWPTVLNMAHTYLELVTQTLDLRYDGRMSPVPAAG
jgi:hypothetical protein